MKGMLRGKQGCEGAIWLADQNQSNKQKKNELSEHVAT